MKNSPYKITRPKATIFWAIASALLLVVGWRQWLPTSLTEMLGFVTGAATVWLLTKENIWNWPIGIASAVFYLVLFWHSRLFADSMLQIFYIVTGFLGWYWWLHGGEKKKELHVQKTSIMFGLMLAMAGALGTIGMNKYLRSVNDSSPFWDSITTVGSLVAQLMLTRKLLENWLLWMSVDIIYVGLYTSRHLYLTAVLYAIFFGMCIVGWRDWLASIRKLVKLPKTGAVARPELEV